MRGCHGPLVEALAGCSLPSVEAWSVPGGLAGLCGRRDRGAEKRAGDGQRRTDQRFQEIPLTGAEAPEPIGGFRLERWALRRAAYGGGGFRMTTSETANLMDAAPFAEFSLARMFN